MKNFFDSPVFICGHPKAGTSLITALLDGHPDVVAYPEETLFFRRFLPAIKGKAYHVQVNLAEELLIHIFKWNQENPPEHQKNFPDRDYSEISFADVRKEMINVLPKEDTQKRDFLSAAVFAFGKVAGLLNPNSRCWVEKSPYNEFYAEKIFKWWSHAKCIHILRDPRDNFVSYHRKQPDWTVKVFAWNWLNSTRAGLANLESFGEERYFLIRFEDLLRKPEENMRRVAAFLGLAWDDALLQPTRVGEAWRGNSMFEQKYRKISTDPIGRRENRLKMYDLALLQVICGKVMSQMGYEVAAVNFKDLSFQERLNLWREKAVTAIKQLG